MPFLAANCKFVRKAGLLGRFAKYTLSESENNRLHAYTNQAKTSSARKENETYTCQYHSPQLNVFRNKPEAKITK